MNLRRKRMMLMDGQWYGYLRTATGNPLTLQAAKRLRKLTIYGNAVQDGTPSPDAPVEVQLCGDRTGNLLDITQISGPQVEVIDNKIYLSGYACATKISPEYFLKMTGLSIGDTITCSNSVEVIGGTVNEVLGRVAFGAKNGGIPWVLCSNNTRTVTIPSDFNNDNYVNLLLYGANQADESGEWLAIMSNLAIYKGSYTADTLPAYEPYGYKISGRAEGINLLDYTKATDRHGNPLTIIDDGVIWDKMIDYYFYIPCDLKSGITVSFSCKSDYPENSDIINSFVVHYVDGSTEYQPIGFSITLKNDVDRIQIRKQRASIESETPIKVTDIMLVQGSYTAETMPPYEPYQPPQDFAVYLPEQIAKVGDVADEITLDFEHKTATRTDKIRQLKDFGVSNCAGIPRQTEQCIRLYNNNVDEGGVDGSPILSTHFVNVTWVSISTDAQNEGVAWYPSGYNRTFYIYLNKTRIDMTADDTIATLATKCNAYIQTLTGREAYYQLLTPVTTDITSLQQWDAMPQVSGTVTLTLSAEVDPSGAEAVYYSKERGE